MRGSYFAVFGKIFSFFSLLQILNEYQKNTPLIYCSTWDSCDNLVRYTVLSNRTMHIGDDPIYLAIFQASSESSTAKLTRDIIRASVLLSRYYCSASAALSQGFLVAVFIPREDHSHAHIWNRALQLGGFFG